MDGRPSPPLRSSPFSKPWLGPKAMFWRCQLQGVPTKPDWPVGATVCLPEAPETAYTGLRQSHTIENAIEKPEPFGFVPGTKLRWVSAVLASRSRQSSGPVGLEGWRGHHSPSGASGRAPTLMRQADIESEGNLLS